MSKSSKDLSIVFGLEPKDAVEYMQNKGYKVTGDWREMWQDAHAKAFTISKMTDAQLLKDSQGIIETALKEGWSTKKAEQKLKNLYQEKGWWGKKEITDKNGETKTVQLGSPHRVRTIFRTNANVAYNTGRYLQQMQDVDFAPYWQYRAIMDDRTRPSHAELDGKTFRYDDPFWQDFYPPNGWLCRCYVNPVSVQNLEPGKLAQSDKLLSREEVVINEDTGEKTQRAVFKADTGGVIRNIKPDAGWSYNPGAAAYNIDVLAYKNVKELPQKVQDIFISNMAQNLHRQASYESFMQNLLDKKYKEVGKDVVLTWIAPKVLSFLEREKAMPLTPIVVCQQKITHFMTTKTAEQVISKSQLLKLYDIINKPDHIFFDTKNNSLIYVAMLEAKEIVDGRNCLKIAVKINKTNKGMPVNYLATPARVDFSSISRGQQYKKVE